MLPLVPIIAAASLATSLAADPPAPKKPGLVPRGASRGQAMDAFWDAFEALAGEKQVVYMGPFQLVGDRQGGVLAKLEIKASIENIDGKPAVHIAYLCVNAEDRQKGYGSRVMQMLVDAADQVGLGMDLDVMPQKERGDKRAPMNKEELRVFYSKYGFVMKGSKYMQRPVTIAAPAPKQVRVDLRKIYAYGPKVEQTIAEVHRGETSYATGTPIVVSRLDTPRGGFYVIDGHHRVVEAIERGDVMLLGTIDTFLPRVERTGGGYRDLLAQKVRVMDLVSKREP